MPTIDTRNIRDLAEQAARREQNLIGFAEACFNQNSVQELRACLKMKSADKTDCETWRITPTQWRAAIKQALKEKLG